jgi:DNA-directed RNA polymerase specialized sigma24 family protein
MKAYRKSHFLDQLVLNLTPEQFVAVILHYFGGLTYQDIASRTGWPYWEVKKHIHAALSGIRNCWGGLSARTTTTSLPISTNSSEGGSYDRAE